MENEFKEYYIFHITAKDGSDVEMAVVDEFEAGSSKAMKSWMMADIFTAVS